MYAIRSYYEYDSIKIAVWHAFATVKLMPDNESLNLTVGEYLPQLSRECATSLFTLTSIEKGTSASYLRKFLLGKTNGIQPGMMLGGLLNTPMPVLYHVGCQFYPNYQNLKYKGSFVITSYSIHYTKLYDRRHCILLFFDHSKNIVDTQKANQKQH